ncbi:hypothetical protein AJ80_02222 [Polytolypa hystricis UAMH7299]|uniref:Uncharacterized protein n=1 Tax=Polytolypa hystricis (strain UAMH7299) TaxID=1447883 RepID=A0A2B7YSE9_POLH7|nr:hypothetical protein AJ80_02222 [Polytolypa hystricis UAMH7299]
MTLRPPSTLAQLPRPLGASSTKYQFSEVQGLAGSKKRKRYEVAAAVDGEGVNIYNVQFPKLVTSYAVPPQSSFSCPPCSVRQKSAHGSNAKRQTYCAIEKPKRQIQSFVDESGAADQQLAGISSNVFEAKDSDSPVVFLDVIPTVAASEEQNDPFDVIAVHKDGQVRRLAADLKSQRWSVQSNASSAAHAFEVQASFLVSFEDARKSLLRKRQDIIAAVVGDDVGVDADASSILVLVTLPVKSKTKAPSDVQVHLYSVTARVQADDLSFSQAKRLRHLMAITLPQLEGEKSLSLEKFHWSMHSSTGELFVSFDTGFIGYDISQFSPTISSSLLLENEQFSSTMRLSPRSIIGAGRSSVAIYNTQYMSVQAADELSSTDTTKAGSKSKPIKFISYLAKLGVVVAVQDTNLLSFDIASSQTRPSRKRSKDGLLINAIGRGIGPPALKAQNTIDQSSVHPLHPLGLTEVDQSQQWTKAKAELSALVKANDLVQFDTVVKSTFGGTSSTQAFIDPGKIFFLLGHIFSLPIKDSEPHLTISFLPKETFTWLIQSGHLSLSNILSAIRQSIYPRIPPTLPQGALVQALVGSKQSINLLLQALQGPVDLDTTELAHALTILLDVARSTSVAADDLPNAVTGTPHKEPTQDIAYETGTDNASSASEKVLIDAITGLNLTLTKLHSRPQDKVLQSIRSVLSNSDTLSIIHHLRHALATGGYTYRYTEEAPSAISSPQIPPLSLSTIVDLLIACIDAIGPSGWISAAGFASAEDTEATLIADMKSEISAALAGVEEATYLKGILREFVRYAETADKSTTTARKGAAVTTTETTANKKLGAKLKRKERHNGAQILVYDTPDNNVEGAIHSDTKILPLSLKTATGDDASDSAVSKTKIRKATGEVMDRSTREIGYLKRKAVGKYSFERIIV